MNLIPLHDNVVVQPITEEKMISGIYIPETADKKKPEQGTVVAVGPGKRMKDGSRTPVSVLVGDKIVFKKYSADEVMVGKDEYLVVKEEDIIAVIK